MKFNKVNNSIKFSWNLIKVEILYRTYPLHIFVHVRDGNLEEEVSRFKDILSNYFLELLI